MTTEKEHTEDLLRLLEELRPEHRRQIYEFARQLRLSGNGRSGKGDDTCPEGVLPTLTEKDKLHARLEWLERQAEDDKAAEVDGRKPKALA